MVYIQDRLSRGLGYALAAATMIIAIIMLLSGTNFYPYRNPQGSPLTVIWRVSFQLVLFMKRNPDCESAPGCGEWKRPMKRNPDYKGSEQGSPKKAYQKATILREWSQPGAVRVIVSLKRMMKN
ncbi:NRT1/ PTR family protein 6.4 [Tanacetum coccineum]